MAQSMGWGVTEEGWKKGPWTAQEDRLLIEYVKFNGEGRWNNVARITGLKRNGKSCRLRWVNYLRPDLKKGQITPHEESVIHEMHAKWGNRWSTIARSLPGRTDNEIKNYWRTHFKKKDKASSEGRGMSWARLLRKQQFHLQQQQQQQREDQTDVKKIVPLFHDESGNRFSSFTQLTAEIMHPSARDEEGYLYSVINGCGNVAEAPSDDMIWNGLWNLDDLLWKYQK